MASRGFRSSWPSVPRKSSRVPSASRRASRSAVTSRTIFAAPTIRPSRSRTRETVSDTSRIRPARVWRRVSNRSTRSPSTSRPRIFLQSSARSAGTRMSTDRPITSCRSYPNRRSADRFPSRIRPSRSLMMIASSLESTTAVNRLAISSRLNASSRVRRMEARATADASAIRRKRSRAMTVLAVQPSVWERKMAPAAVERAVARKPAFRPKHQDAARMAGRKRRVNGVESPRTGDRISRTSHARATNPAVQTPQTPPESPERPARRYSPLPAETCGACLFDFPGSDVRPFSVTRPPQREDEDAAEDGAQQN